jgi:hypothetical protein
VHTGGTLSGEGAVVTPELESEYRRLLIEEGLAGVLARSEELRRRPPLGSSELPPDLRQALADRQDFQGILNSVSVEIEEHAPLVVDAYRRGAAQNGEPGLFSADVDVMCAEFPTGAFEGEARRVSGRSVLVLINAGLVALLAQTAKLVVLTTAIVDGGRGFQYVDDVRLRPFGVTVDRALADVLARYLGRPASRAGGVALPTEPADLARIDELYRGMVFFTVAHEYAHAYAHHHEYRHPAGEPPGVLEGEADWLAVKLMLGRWRWGGLSDEDRSRELHALLPGPFMWFGLERLVTRAEELDGRATDLEVVLASHSPTMIREAELRDYYDRAGLSRSLADLYEAWIWRHAPAILAELRRAPRSTEPA